MPTSAPENVLLLKSKQLTVLLQQIVYSNTKTCTDGTPTRTYDTNTYGPVSKKDKCFAEIVGEVMTKLNAMVHELNINEGFDDELFARLNAIGQGNEDSHVDVHVVPAKWLPPGQAGVEGGYGSPGTPKIMMVVKGVTLDNGSDSTDIAWKELYKLPNLDKKDPKANFHMIRFAFHYQQLPRTALNLASKAQMKAYKKIAKLEDYDTAELMQDPKMVEKLVKAAKQHMDTARLRLPDARGHGTFTNVCHAIFESQGKIKDILMAREKKLKAGKYKNLQSRKSTDHQSQADAFEKKKKSLEKRLARRKTVATSSKDVPTDNAELERQIEELDQRATQNRNEAAQFRKEADAAAEDWKKAKEEDDEHFRAWLAKHSESMNDIRLQMTNMDDADQKHTNAAGATAPSAPPELAPAAPEAQTEPRAVPEPEDAVMTEEPEAQTYPESDQGDQSDHGDGVAPSRKRGRIDDSPMIDPASDQDDHGDGTVQSRKRVRGTTVVAVSSEEESDDGALQSSKAVPSTVEKELSFPSEEEDGVVDATVSRGPVPSASPCPSETTDMDIDEVLMPPPKARPAPRPRTTPAPAPRTMNVQVPRNQPLITSFTAATPHAMSASARRAPSDASSAVSAAAKRQPSAAAKRQPSAAAKQRAGPYETPAPRQRRSSGKTSSSSGQMGPSVDHRKIRSQLASEIASESERKTHSERAKKVLMRHRKKMKRISMTDTEEDDERDNRRGHKESTGTSPGALSTDEEDDEESDEDDWHNADTDMNDVFDAKMKVWYSELVSRIMSKGEDYIDHVKDVRFRILGRNKKFIRFMNGLRKAKKHEKLSKRVCFRLMNNMLLQIALSETRIEESIEEYDKAVKDKTDHGAALFELMRKANAKCWRVTLADDQRTQLAEKNLKICDTVNNLWRGIAEDCDLHQDIECEGSTKLDDQIEKLEDAADQMRKNLRKARKSPRGITKQALTQSFRDFLEAAGNGTMLAIEGPKDDDDDSDPEATGTTQEAESPEAVVDDPGDADDQDATEEPEAQTIGDESAEPQHASPDSPDAPFKIDGRLSAAFKNFMAANKRNCDMCAAVTSRGQHQTPCVRIIKDVPRRNADGDAHVNEATLRNTFLFSLLKCKPQTSGDFKEQIITDTVKKSINTYHEFDDGDPPMRVCLQITIDAQKGSTPTVIYAVLTCASDASGEPCFTFNVNPSPTKDFSPEYLCGMEVSTDDDVQTFWSGNKKAGHHYMLHAKHIKEFDKALKATMTGDSNERRAADQTEQFNEWLDNNTPSPWSPLWNTLSQLVMKATTTSKAPAQAP